MKKLVILGFALVLSLPLSVYAASIGGAETQGQGRFGIGLEQEFLFDRDMKWDGSNWVVFAPGVEVKDIEMDRLCRTMLKTSYGLLDNLDVYVKLGMADFDLEGKIHGVYTGKGVYKGESAFAYGFGLKGAYSLEGLEEEWLIGVDLQYHKHRNRYQAKFSLVSPPVLEIRRGRATIQEWHIAPYLAQKLEDFTPYFGIKYSEMKVKTESDDGRWEKYDADDNFGVFLGTDYKIGEDWNLNFEARFIDETAMSLACTHKF